MTEDDAARIIQKKYRGHLVRKELGPLVKTTTGKLDEESTLFMRRWYKKWKAKTIFQVLLMYRAAKHQELVYFCQQAHLFNINFISNLESNNIEVDLKEIDPKAQVSTYLTPYRPTVHKLPFRLKDAPFFDSNCICDPIQGYRVDSIKIEDEEESWDAPLQKHVSILKRRKVSFKDKECQTTLRKNHNSLSETPFIRDPTKPVVPVIKTDKSCQFQKLDMPKDPIKPKAWSVDLKKVENRYKYQTNGPYKSPSQIVSANDYTRDNSPYRAPLSVKKSQNVNNPIKELEEKCKRKITSENSDEPPFNFQAMLRKTNNSRASFKRNKNENVVYNSENYVNLNIKKFSLKKTKAPAPPKQEGTIETELAPGIIIRGEIAEL